MSEENTTALTTPTETGMTQEQREEMLKDDSLGNLKLVHGIMITGLKAQGINADPGDYVLSGATVIRAGMQGPGFVAQPLSDRPRALLFDGNNLLSSSYDTRSRVWSEIAAKAAAWQKGAKVGAEFLCWLPEYNALATFLVANKDRQTLYPKIVSAMMSKKFIQINSGMKPSKNGLQVFPVVNILNDVVVGKYKLTEERREIAFKAFDAYKSEKTAPPQAPSR